MSGAKITVRNHGPLRVEGEYTIVDQDGKAYGLGERTAVSLCRCGRSENLPFCDGAHGRCGFQSECEAHDL